jgi:hypothetical protein
MRAGVLVGPSASCLCCAPLRSCFTACGPAARPACTLEHTRRVRAGVRMGRGRIDGIGTRAHCADVQLDKWLDGRLMCGTDSTGRDVCANPAEDFALQMLARRVQSDAVGPGAMVIYDAGAAGGGGGGCNIS